MFDIQPALVRVIHDAMVKVSRRGRHALGFRSTDITMNNSDPNRLVYGLAKASLNVPHGIFSDALHDEAGGMGVRYCVHLRRFCRLVMSFYVLPQDTLSIIKSSY